MITTVQGMNHKNNKAVQTVSALAGMDSLINGNKVLIIQLINPDIDTADNILNKNTEITYGNSKNTFAETGIDSLLRICSSTVLGVNEFEQYCTPIRKTKFALDVCEISKNDEFTKTVANRLDDIKEILESASEVYQNVYILVDSKDDLLIKEINELDIVNRSIYCLRQGHMNKGNVYGNNIFYVVTDYHDDSEFSMKAMKNAYVTKKEPIYPLSFNIRVTDASMKGRLIYFILHNTNTDKTDVNYEWNKDIKEILVGLEKMREAKEKKNDKNITEYEPVELDDFSKFSENRTELSKDAVVRTGEELVAMAKENEKKKKGFFLFGKKKKAPSLDDEVMDLRASINTSSDDIVAPLDLSEVLPDVDIPDETEEIPTVEKKTTKKATTKKATPTPVKEFEPVVKNTTDEVVEKPKTTKKATATKKATTATKTTTTKSTASTTKKATTTKTASTTEKKTTAKTGTGSTTKSSASKTTTAKKSTTTAKKSSTATAGKKAPAKKTASKAEVEE